MDTYKYLAKSRALQPGVANKESSGFFDTYKNYTLSHPDHIMTLST
jgi:hypothetical protein